MLNPGDFFSFSLLLPDCPAQDNSHHTTMAFVSDLEFECLESDANQALVSPLIYPEMLFQEDPEFLPYLDPGYSLPAFTADPVPPGLWSSNNYLVGPFPTTYQRQRSSTAGRGWGEDNTAHGTPFYLSTGTHIGWMDHGNSPLQFPCEPSQSAGGEPTFNPRNIGQIARGDVSYGERSPTRSTKHVPIPCDSMNLPLIAITDCY